MRRFANGILKFDYIDAGSAFRGAVVSLAAAVLLAAPAIASPFAPEKFEVGFGTSENSIMYRASIEGTGGSYPARGPAAIQILDENRVAVLDTFNGAVKIFDAAGKITEKIDAAAMVRPESKTSEIVLSAMAAIKNQKGKDEFYIADSANGRVHILSGGRLVRSLGVFGKGKYELTRIERLAVAPNGNIMAGDSGNKKIVVFSDLGVGIREIPWSPNGFAVNEKHIYTIESPGGGRFVFLRSGLSNSEREALFTLSNPGWRMPHIIGVDRFGGVLASFFDDSIQAGLIKEKSDHCPGGYFTVASISPSGQMRHISDVPAAAPPGDQFFFDRSSNCLYYQNFDAGKAPKGKYGIIRIRPDCTWAEKSDKLTPKELADIKTSLTEVEYGVGAAKLSGSSGIQAARLPLLRADGKGCLYLLDRVGGKIIVIQENFSAPYTVEFNYQLGIADEASKVLLDDIYPVSTKELYLLDSRGRRFYKMTLKDTDKKGAPSYDVSGKPIEKGMPDRPSALFATTLGDVMIHSISEGRAVYFGSGGSHGDSCEVTENSIFAMPNSDILALTQNDPSREISMKYFDFHFNPMERFNKKPSITAAGNVSAGRIFGVDSAGNIFLTYFDGASQKIAIFSMSGDKFCEFEIRVPQNYGYLAASLCVGPEGTIYIGIPRPSKYYIARISYQTIINFISSEYLKSKK